MRIDFFRNDTTNLLDALVDYQAAMEAQLVIVQGNEQKRIMAWTSSTDSAEFDIARDEYTWTYDFTFPRYLRYSFIVLLFLVVESKLYGLCDEIGKRRGVSDKKAKALDGNVFQRCKKYLHESAGISRLNEPLWIEMEDLSKVRHCVVHTLGKVDLSKDKDHIQHIAAQKRGLSISDNELPEEGVIVVTAEYCAKAVANARQFFNELLDAAGFGPAISMF